MSMPLSGRAVLATLAVSAAALATAPDAGAAPRGEWVFIDETRADMTPAGGPPPSRLIFMNDCKANNGCRIVPGRESSMTNRSTIADQISIVPPFTHSDQIWQRTLDCVKKVYARFDIRVTDEDPCPDPNSGCTTPHWEIIVAGRAEDIGYESSGGGVVGGVSPFNRSTCPIIENSITYAFAEVIGPNVDQLCWTIAQETAHSFGLDHEFLATDPMTYLPNPPHKEFQDVEAQCGETAVRQCYCGYSRRNSVRELLGIFGAAPPSPPVVTIVSPQAGASVDPGFPVVVELADDQGIAQVELLVDGVSVITLESPPFAFNAPATLLSGSHRVEVRATDWNGTPGAGTVEVRIGEPCTRPSDCSAAGDQYTCVGGRCVVGPGTPGGLGEPCTSATECDSRLCATSGSETYCAETCAVGSNDCPSGFACEAVGDGSGLCWPAPEAGCLGCASSGGRGAPVAPIGIGIVLAALCLRRRRRPRAHAS